MWLGLADRQDDRWAGTNKPMTLARHGHVHSWVSGDCSVDSGETAACDAAAYTDTLVDLIYF